MYSGRWKAHQEGGVEGGVAELSLKDKDGQEIEKQLPGGKVKKKSKPEVILETNTRSKKKCVTTILGKLPLISLPSKIHPKVFGSCPAYQSDT